MATSLCWRTHSIQTNLKNPFFEATKSRVFKLGTGPFVKIWAKSLQKQNIYQHIVIITPHNFEGHQHEKDKKIKRLGLS